MIGWHLTIGLLLAARVVALAADDPKDPKKAPAPEVKKVTVRLEMVEKKLDHLTRAVKATPKKEFKARGIKREVVK